MLTQSKKNKVKLKYIFCTSKINSSCNYQVHGMQEKHQLLMMMDL